MEPIKEDRKECPDPNKEIMFINDMRLVWEQHVYWTRLLIISIAERLKDEKCTEARLLRNPGDLAQIFRQYYSADVAGLISRLATEHLQIGAALITALRDGKNAEADSLNRQWYENADKIADAFAKINPHYKREEVRRMFYKHLDITKQEAAMRLAGNYSADIAAFDNAEKEMLAMSDMFAIGILDQFPERFI